MKKLALHGSSKLFKKFLLNQEEKNSVYGNMTDYGLGIFFTDNDIMSKWFAGCLDYNPDIDDYESTDKLGFIYKTELEINKALTIDDAGDYEDTVQKYFELIDKVGGPIELRNKLISEGYDSIIIRNCTTNYYLDGTYTIYIVLNPEQTIIKKITKYSERVKKFEN